MTKGLSNPDSDWEGPTHSVVPSESQMTAPAESPQSFGSVCVFVSGKEMEEKEQGEADCFDAKDLLRVPSGEYIGMEEQASACNSSVPPATCPLQPGEEKAQSSEEHVAPAEPHEKQNGSFLDSHVGNQFPTLIRSFQVVTG